MEKFFFKPCDMGAPSHTVRFRELQSIDRPRTANSDLIAASQARHRWMPEVGLFASRIVVYLAARR
jgi:hypothetical protein